MLEINGLKKSYGQTTAVDIASLQIADGERVGLVGNNGAGKTTLLSLILDLVKADNGDIKVGSVSVQDSEDWKTEVATFLDESFLVDFLTPEEYFYLVGRTYGLSKEEVDQRLEQWTDFFHGEILQKGKYIRDLSKGNKKKVGIVGALLSRPKLLLLDEPFANLDPSTQYRLQQILLQQAKEITIFVSSHDLTHVSEVCSRIIILEKGKIVADMASNSNTLIELKSYFTTKSDVNEI